MNLRSCLTLITLLFSPLAWSLILFPEHDPFLEEKQLALHEINDLMGGASAARPLMESEGILFWANRAAVIPEPDSAGYQETELPSFTPRSAHNEAH